MPSDHERPDPDRSEHERSDRESHREPLPPALTSDSDFVRRARNKYGAMGAIVASSMLGLDKLLGRKPKDDGAVVWEASGEPEDIDKDGISIPIDESTTAHATSSLRARGRHVRKRRYRE
jgi:hypothetical protein